MSFRIKLAILFSFIFTIFYIVVFNYFIRKSEEFIEKEFIEKGKSIVSSLALISKEHLLDENLPELARLTYSLKKENKSILFVYLVDKKGIIKGSPESPKLGKKIEDVLKIEKKKEVKIFEKEIEYGGHLIGKAIVGISPFILNQARIETRKGALLIFFPLLFTGIFVIFLFTHLSLRPLTFIVSVLKKIGQGNLEEKIEYRAKDEFGVITKEVEEMRKNLIRAQEEIKIRERLHRDAELAKSIQNMLLPVKLPKIKGFDITFYYEPAFYVGGDYCDVLYALTHTLCVIGDVSGKGVSSSIIMALTKSFIYSNYKFSRNPVSFAVQLHSFLQDKMPDDMFLTIFFLFLHPHGEFLYSSCGHISPFIFTSRKEKIEKFKTNGVPVGFSFVSPAEYPAYIQRGSGKLEKGDFIFMYTDGVVDLTNENNEFFGEERLKSLLYNVAHMENVEKMKEKIVQELKNFKKTKETEDDITFLIIRKL
jgi:serine phosphatase RsbU (regulator of sigma subunit)